MLRCAVLDDYQNAARSLADWQRLDDQVAVDVFTEHLPDEDARAAALAEYDIIVAMRERTPFGRALLERLPRLRLLVTTGMRNASIDLDAAAACGVMVCGTQGAPGATSELAWGLILALARRIPQEVANFRAGGAWQTTLGTGLHGKRLGVIGLGNLGTRVARVGIAFDMKVTAWSRGLTAERCAAVGVELAPGLDTLLRGADVISIHATLNPTTRGLIGARELGLMKPGALLVNTSRGPIVDSQALIDCLRAGRIGGAAVDVFDQEPLPAEHAFRGLQGLIATPHLGYVTEETYRVFYGMAVEDIAAWLTGHPVRVLGGRA